MEEHPVLFTAEPSLQTQNSGFLMLEREITGKEEHTLIGPCGNRSSEFKTEVLT